MKETKTRDIYFTSTLRTKGFDLMGVEFDKGIAFFKFQDSKAFRDAQTKYFAGMLLIEPLAFLEQLSKCKREIKKAKTMNNERNNFGRLQL